jgi:hypothetical protein
MKIVACGLVSILLAVIAQAHFIGINGLTILTIPMTIFLGFNTMENLLNNNKTK